MTLSGPILETDRLLISPPGSEDLGAMISFFSEQRSEFFGGPLTEAEAWRAYAVYVGQWTLRGYGLFAVRLKDTGETVGMAGPYHPGHFREPEMSWLVTSAAYEGKGYAAEASRAVLDHLFADLGWTTTVSFINYANHPSQALALRLCAVLDPDTPAQVDNCRTYRHMAPGAAA